MPVYIITFEGSKYGSQINNITIKILRYLFFPQFVKGFWRCLEWKQCKEEGKKDLGVFRNFVRWDRIHLTSLMHSNFHYYIQLSTKNWEQVFFNTVHTYLKKRLNTGSWWNNGDLTAKNQFGKMIRLSNNCCGDKKWDKNEWKDKRWRACACLRSQPLWSD